MFTTNFADGAVSRYMVGGDGALTLEDATGLLDVVVFEDALAFAAKVVEERRPLRRVRLALSESAPRVGNGHRP